MVYLKCLTLLLELKGGAMPLARHLVWKKQERDGHTTSPRTKTFKPVNNVIVQLHDIESCRSVLEECVYVSKCESNVLEKMLIYLILAQQMRNK